MSIEQIAAICTIPLGAVSVCSLWVSIVARRETRRLRVAFSENSNISHEHLARIRTGFEMLGETVLTLPLDDAAKLSLCDRVKSMRSELERDTRRQSLLTRDRTLTEPSLMWFHEHGNVEDRSFIVRAQECGLLASKSERVLAARVMVRICESA